MAALAEKAIFLLPFLLSGAVFTVCTETPIKIRIGNFLGQMSSGSENAIRAVIYDVLSPSSQIQFADIGRGCFSNFQNWTRSRTIVGINITVATTPASFKYSEVYQIQNSSLSDNTTASINVWGRLDQIEVFVDWSCHNPWEWSSVDKIDTATLKLSSNLSYPVRLGRVSGDCFECAIYEFGAIFPGQTLFLGADTKFAYNLYLGSVDNISSWVNVSYSDHGRYYIRIVDVSNNNTLMLDHSTDHSGPNAYFPILYAFILLTGIALVYTALKFLQWRYKLTSKIKNFVFKRNNFEKDFGHPPSFASSINGANKDPLVESQSEQRSGIRSSSGERTPLIISRKTSPEQTASSGENSGAGRKKKRLQSLDTFRGMSLTIMIFVNYGGGGYWFFDHSRWNGLTVADLVFPWFVWIMGVSIVYSFNSRHSDSIFSQLYQIARRTVILFFLGIFISQKRLAKAFLWETFIAFRDWPSFSSVTMATILRRLVSSTDLSRLRIPGVLQRFAVSYFVVALTELLTTRYLYKKGFRRMKHKIFVQIRDLTNNWVQWIVTVVLVVVWVMVTFLLPLDSLNSQGVHCPRGYLGPGGLADYGQYAPCTAGAARAIDLWIFGDAHIYHRPTCKDIYHCSDHEPEGLLGSLTSVAICFLGLQCGKILKHFASHKHRVSRMLLWGLVLTLLGAALCEFRKDGGLIPINKNLWSLSFILVMAGTGFLVLTLFYLLIDVLNVWSGAPFIYPGMNSIFIYVGSEIVTGFPFFWDGPHTHLAKLAENVTAVTLWCIVAFYCHWIGFFVKI